jgi:hypothetical protein
MGKNVFANGREISAKKDANRSIAAMPDVCLSPPSPPAGPIPIPYPNTAQASDTTDGSKTVKIGGDEVGLKNTSAYKKSNGDEAATKSFGMGVVTHTIQDKMRHAAWSFDVKFEGANVIRHMDLTTHNHMNTQNSGSMTCNQAAAQVAAGGELNCQELDEANQDARANELQDLPAGHAVTTSFYKPATGNPSFMKACSNTRATRNAKGWQPVVQHKNMPPCAGGRATSSGRRHDSENKTLDPLMRAGSGGSILMKTFHISGAAGAVADNMPCASCRNAICEASRCGITVTLCNNKNEKVPASKVCNSNGTPKGGGGDSDPLWASFGL